MGGSYSERVLRPNNNNTERRSQSEPRARPQPHCDPNVLVGADPSLPFRIVKVEGNYQGGLWRVRNGGHGELGNGNGPRRCLYR